MATEPTNKLSYDFATNEWVVTIFDESQVEQEFRNADESEAKKAALQWIETNMGHLLNGPAAFDLGFAEVVN